MLIAFDWKYVDDMLERLTEAQAGTLSGGSITSETRNQVFDLDQVGNWTHTDLITGGSTTEFDWDFTHNKVNEITGWDNQTNNVAPTYDAAGNMTDDKRDWKYEYDAWYRLVRVKDQSNNVKAEFAYNALGCRLSARYDETAPWMHFSYDERWRIVAMYEDDADASEPTEQFWYQNAGDSGMGGSSYIDDVVLRDRDTDANGTLDERRYYLQNQHHDVVALINTSGSISERVNYDPYGSPIGTFSSIANRKGYAGYEYDEKISTGGAAGSNTCHIRHRVYRSDLGVWTRRDPLGYVDGMGLYEYAGARPIIAHDPIGMALEQCSEGVCLTSPPWPIQEGDVPPNSPHLREPFHHHGPYFSPYPLRRRSCGSGWNEPFVPDTPFGNNLTPCCDEHDACYARCDRKAVCDGAFGACILLSCLQSGRSPAACAALAAFYVVGVKALGNSAYCKGCPSAPECLSPPPAPIFPPRLWDVDTPTGPRNDLRGPYRQQ